MAEYGNDERILVFILAYNEEGIIQQVVADTRAALPHAEILVIDDGSEDDTNWVARRAGARVIRHPFNLGIGGAMQTGLKFAQQEGYTYVVRMDGDGQHNAAEIDSLLAVLRQERTDLVFGSRFLESTFDWQIPLMRRIGIRLYSLVVSALIGTASTDTTSGFCAMNQRAVAVLARYLPQDYPDVESRIIAYKAGLTQLELPVNMRARAAGVSSIGPARSLYYAFKVTVAVLTSAMKDIAKESVSSFPRKDPLHVNSIRTKGHRRFIQPYAGAGDAPPDPHA